MGRQSRHHPLQTLPAYNTARCSLLSSALLLALLSSLCTTSSAFSFTLDRDECFVQHVPPDQYNMVAFVVSHYGSYWSSSNNPNEIDLKVSDPHGKELLSVTRKSQEETYYYSQEEGEYKFCFHNLGPQHAQVSFDLQSYTDWLNRKAEPLKGEALDDVHKEMSRLQNDLMTTHHEVWYAFFLAQQHMEVDKAIGKKLVRKAILQGLLLVVCGAAQIILLRRLVEKRVVRASKV